MSVAADYWPRQSLGPDYVSQSQRCGLMEISLVWHKSQLLKSHKNPRSKMMEHVSSHSLHLPGLWYKYCEQVEGQRNFGNVSKIITDTWVGTTLRAVIYIASTQGTCYQSDGTYAVLTTGKLVKPMPCQSLNRKVTFYNVPHIGHNPTQNTSSISFQKVSMSSNTHLMRFPSNLPWMWLLAQHALPQPYWELQPPLRTAYLQLSSTDFTLTAGFSSYKIENCLIGGKAEGESRSNSGFLHLKSYSEWT